MNYQFKASENFWKRFYHLSSGQKESVRRAWTLFKSDPFDPRLGTHRIVKLSAHYRKTVYSVVVEADLRIIFYLEGNIVWTVDVGTHGLYR